MTLLERGIDMASRLLPAAAGGEITYAHGAITVKIDAAFGSSEFATSIADGVLVEHSDRDFIFPAADLVLSGVVATPTRGDRITVGTEVFEVMAPGGAQVYRPCDPQGAMIRVHTKKL